MSDTSPSEEEDVDPNITEDEYMKHLFIDLLYDTAMCLAQECVKSSCQGFGHAFGAGLNAQRASVWLGFGNMLKEALLTLKANSDPKKRTDEDNDSTKCSEEPTLQAIKTEQVLKDKVNELVGSINTNLSTTGIVAALIVTIIVPLFTTKMAYINSGSATDTCTSSSNLSTTANFSGSPPVAAASCAASTWWGDAYASVLETIVMAMMCGAFVSAILAVSLTVAVSTAINMKMVEAKDKLFFIRNQSGILILPNILMVISLNLIYFSLPLAIAYVQGQPIFIISAIVFGLALALFLFHLIRMEAWVKRYILPRCLRSAADYLQLVDELVRESRDTGGREHVVGRYTGGSATAHLLGRPAADAGRIGRHLASLEARSAPCCRPARDAIRLRLDCMFDPAGPAPQPAPGDSPVSVLCYSAPDLGPQQAPSTALS